MAATQAWLVCAALALAACSTHAHTHSAPLTAVAGAAPDGTTSSRATGMFFIDLDDGKGAWNITLRGISAANVTSPSLHDAPAGSTVGPEILPLRTNVTTTRTAADGSVVLKGDFTAADYTGPLKGRPFDAIHARLHEGTTYVVVPTRQSPAGALKGAVNATVLDE